MSSDISAIFGSQPTQLELPIENPIAEQTPLAAISVKPPINEDLELIATISTLNFDMLVKILGFLEKSGDTIVIKDSQINQSMSGAIITANVSKAFDNKKINLDILNPKKNIKLLKQFKNNNDVLIYKDENNKRFIITNGEIRLFLPQQVESLTESIGLPDNLSEAKWPYQIKIDKAASKQILGLASETNYIEYIIQDEKLKALHIPNTAIYIFNEYVGDPKTLKLDETNADILLRSDVFLPITAEEYQLAIGQLPGSSTYVSYVECNLGFDDIKVGIYEDLKNCTGGDLFG
jgi:hypothetical protein